MSHQLDIFDILNHLKMWQSIKGFVYLRISRLWVRVPPGAPYLAVDPPLTPTCRGQEPAFWVGSLFMVQIGAVVVQLDSYSSRLKVVLEAFSPVNRL